MRGLGIFAQSVILTTVLLLIAAGVTLTLRVTPLGIFLGFIVAVAAFHTLLYFNGNSLTALSLRYLEYAYISLGLVGLVGVLELQSSLVSYQEKAVLGRHAPYEGFSELGACDREGITGAERRICSYEKEYRSLFDHYDHEKALRMTQIAAGMENHPVVLATKSRREDVKRLYDDMQDEIYRYVIDTKSTGWLLFRMFGFFALLIGVAIKIAKTTGEIVIDGRKHN